ncbi:MAG: hypothetical protein HY747_08765 [Elusimicrobia bacterium]|nr:hypothetical protein [Elusimicrobiota bacterium]
MSLTRKAGVFVLLILAGLAAGRLWADDNAGRPSLESEAVPPAPSAPPQNEIVPESPLPAGQASGLQDKADEEKMRQWIEDKGGIVGDETSKNKAPALEFLREKKAQEQEENKSGLERRVYADEDLRADQPRLERAVPQRGERASRKEKKFFKEHKLNLEVDRLGQDQIMRPPRAEAERGDRGQKGSRARSPGQQSHGQRHEKGD